MDRIGWITTAAAAVAILAHAWSIWRLAGSKRRLERMAAVAREEFRAVQVEAADARFSLDGRHAEVVQEEITGYEETSFAFTLYARNEMGEYFMFKSSASGQMVKHVEPHVARVVLKHKFVVPGGGAA